MNRVVLIVASLCSFVLGAYLLVTEARQFTSEYTHRADVMEPAGNVQLLEGRCRSKLVISMCDLKVRDQMTRKTEKFGYVFIGHQGGGVIDVLRSKSNPSFLTTDLGRDNFWNRLIASIALVLLLLTSSIVLLRRSFLPPQANAPAHI